MGSVTVIFVGLIAHVLTSGGVQRAVFVAAPEHDARIVVQRADLLDWSGFREDVAAENTNERAFAIDGQHVVVGSGDAAPAIESSFRDHVLSLSTITDATALRDEIDSATPYGGVSAYLDLFGGTLSAGDRQYALASFGSSRATQCLSRTVRYVGDATIFRGAGGAYLRVRAGATVRVENLPPPTYRAPHFHMYTLLMKDATVIASPVQLGACAADEPAEHRHFSARTAAWTIQPMVVGQVDCSSSQWP